MIRSSPAAPVRIRARRVMPRAVALLIVLLLAGAGRAAAQLRPLEPPVWAMWETDARLAISVGGGVLQRQRASLAGVEGTLLELGNYHASWRTGRVVLEVGGTAVRRFEDRSRFAAPTADVDTTVGPRRSDAGDVRIATLVRLTPEQWPALVLARFGTRLPTPDNRIGLDRDLTDFFALLGARYARGGLEVGAEAGVGLHGSRLDEFEQDDVILYSTTVRYRRGLVEPVATLVGHWDGLPGWYIRGNEDLRELRLGLGVGARVRAEAQWVHGLTDFSPRSGVLVSLGARW
jgi:hypothetical protein